MLSFQLRERIELRLEMTDAAALAGELEAIDPGAWDGLAVKATDAPGIREAIDDLVEAGLSVGVTQDEIDRIAGA